MYHSYMSRYLGDRRTRKDFDNIFDWQSYKRDIEVLYREHQKQRGTFRTSSFYWLHDKRDFLKFFHKGKLRKLILLERYCQVLRQRGILPERPTYTLEDFIVHFHHFGTTFSQSYEQTVNDLNSLSNDEYYAILDSVLYKDVIIYRLPRVRPRLIKFAKGMTYTEHRIKGIPRKMIFIKTHSTKTYFTKKERIIMGTPTKALIRDRVKWYKDCYERIRDV